MTNYIVVDDVTGDFVAIDHIVAIIDDEDGAKILVGPDSVSIHSPLKPRELLRRLTIIKYKRDNEKRPDDTIQATVANPRRSTL
jgi:hypothetical protein